MQQFILPSFEDFEIGQCIVSSTRTITETDVVNYCCLSGNWQPMHCDVEQAKKSIYGQRIVQGALVYTIALGLALSTPGVSGEVVANYGLDKMRFPHPLFINDTIRVETIVENKGEHRLGGMLTLRFNVKNQNDELCCFFIQRVVVKTRASRGAA